jgi:hypothetical protein
MAPATASQGQTTSALTYRTGQAAVGFPPVSRCAIPSYAVLVTALVTAPSAITQGSAEACLPVAGPLSHGEATGPGQKASTCLHGDGPQFQAVLEAIQVPRAGWRTPADAAGPGAGRQSLRFRGQLRLPAAAEGRLYDPGQSRPGPRPQWLCEGLRPGFLTHPRRAGTGAASPRARPCLTLSAADVRCRMSAGLRDYADVRLGFLPLTEYLHRLVVGN